MRWMKLILSAGLALPAIALADEPPKRNSPQQYWLLAENEPNPRPAPGQPRAEQNDLEQARATLEQALRNGHHEKGTYLGVSATPPPAVLRKQLGLPAGMGLVIDFVVPDSPAAKAGLQNFDVLQKLDDQLIVNREQLTVLVRSRKAGDEVKVSIIREGKPLTLTAKLIESDVEPLPLGEERELDLQLQRLLTEPQVGPQGRALDPLTGGWKAVNAGSTVSWIEDGRSYTVTTSRDGKKTYIVKDKERKTLFEGPINTDEEREKVPAELRAKLNTLQQHLPGATTRPALQLLPKSEQK